MAHHTGQNAPEGNCHDPQSAERAQRECPEGTPEAVRSRQEAIWHLLDVLFREYMQYGEAHDLILHELW